ncbi:MAG: CAP family protein [Ferruginibacter sp.]
MYKLLIGLMFWAQYAGAQNSIAVTGSSLKSTDAQAILAHHNKVRKEKAVPALTWSTTLSAYAQKWADYLATQNNCEIKHRDFSGENGKSYGENIFWGSSAAAYPPIEASKSWYDEKKEYTYRKISMSTWGHTGHYTQMIWKETKVVGVGIAICPNGAVIIVANYYPAGNVIGEYPY